MNLAYLIDRGAKWYPDTVAVVDDNGRHLVTEVYSRANQLAHALAKLGNKKGDRMAIVCRNCVEYIETDFAIYKSGLIRVALNPRLSPKEILTMLNDSGTKTMLVSSDHADMLEKIRPELKTVQHIIVVAD